MSIEVRVPATGNAGEDVVVLEWTVTVGQTVQQGDLLATLETAKATVEVDAPASGIVLEIAAAKGAQVAEHAVLAVLGEPSAQPVPPQDRSKASPRAVILAERNGIDLAQLKGSGPAGRIIVPDVLAAKARVAPRVPDAPMAVALARAEEATPVADLKDFELVPVQGARKVTAQRMHESLQSTAQVTLTRYANADTLFEFATRLKKTSEMQHVPRIGVNELLLFAVSRAVMRHPETNSAFEWEGIRRYRNVNLGFAVDTGQVLLVPVIPLANTLSLTQLSQAARDAIDRANAGRVTNDEMATGTFTVSNLGSLGVHWFTPVLNPPQVCILGVGAAHQSHEKAPRQLPLSLTFDHRALDGVAAARLLADIAMTIESIDVLSVYNA